MNGELIIEGKVLQPTEYGGEHYNIIYDEWEDIEDIDAFVDEIIKKGYLKRYFLGIPQYYLLENMSNISFKIF